MVFLSKFSPFSHNERSALTNILPLCFISFFLACNYFILKTLKDSLLVTAEGAGAEALPFVKMWVLFPSSVIFVAAFTWISTRFSIRAGFTTTIIFFLFSYALFAFVLYPLGNTIHLHNTADQLEAYLPAGWRGLAAVVRYWSYTFYYVTAECWCSMVYSVVFWGFANEVTKLQDARRYYPLLTLAGTIAALCAGPFAIFLSTSPLIEQLPYGTNSWEKTFYTLTGVVLICGCAALFFFLRFCHFPQNQFHFHTQKTQNKKSFKQLFQSKYLLVLATIAFSYNMMINLTEVLWKNEVLKLYPQPNEFNAYLSYVTMITGIVSMFFTLFLSQSLLKRLGWTLTAMITPIIALVTGFFFFAALFLEWYGWLHNALSITAFLGSIHICLSCSGKYTLFEPAKEMAFIPLNSDEKLRGKAAIDGVGTRLGKTGSAMLYQTLLMVFPTVTYCTPFIAVAILGMIGICMGGIRFLGKEVEAHTQPA